jgi:N-acetylglutamate synthase-like GNAT family acetyltransferase
MEVLTIERAGSGDSESVRELLADAGLPTEGIPSATLILLVARRGTRILGAAAVEQHGPQGLLRSVVVTPSERSRGLGRQLVRAALRTARELGVREVGLLTLDAAIYFEGFGFRVVERSAVSGPILESIEFTHLCPRNATAMWLDLGQEGVRDN